MNDLDKAQMMAPEGEFLAYINPKEAGILKALGGSGKMTAMGIPSFTEDEEDTGDVSNPGSGGGSGGGGNNDGGGGDQEDDNARMMQAMGLTGPGFTNRGGGNDSNPQNFFQTIGNKFNQGITGIGNYYQNNSRGILGSILGSAMFGPLGMILGGYAGRNFDSIRDRFSPDYETDDTIENTELRAKPFSMPFGVMPNQKPVIFQDGPSLNISNLMANKPDYKVGDISDKTFNAAIGSGFNPYTGEELQPGEAQELEDQRNNQSNLGLGSFIV
jgi:hypothetical protein